MTSKNNKVQRATALALYKLSSDSYNCVTLHRSGVVKVLMKTSLLSVTISFQKYKNKFSTRTSLAAYWMMERKKMKKPDGENIFIIIDFSH